MKARFFLNRSIRQDEQPSPPNRTPLAFHRRFAGYKATPLIDVPELAELLGIRQVLVKDESSRLGLPAFKILGASWAVYRTLQADAAASASGSFGPWSTLGELADQLAPLKPLTLATATDGNHGRAVARVAALLGFAARIFVPTGTAQSRIDAIAGEGASVEVVNGTYEDAVARAAREANARCLVISDTSWPGYEEVPRWIVEGYSTILWEIEDELARRRERNPDVFAVQFGVGALAAAVVRHYRVGKADERPKILSVEPLHAACMLAAMEAGEIVTVPGPHDSIMAGLNCGRVSMVAWPVVSSGIDAFIAVKDERAREAMRALARAGIVAGETGAAGLAGLIELLTGADNANQRLALGINASTRALVIVTEGATDPQSYRSIVGE
jgi:diaminopropionate ammonia-lyase